jgi:phenylalanyl-tRNA synthetase alpha chain
MLKKYGPVFKAISPGRCFRNEATDATHENTFFQVEGIMVGEDVSVAGYFPFVEPGFELDINCLICGGGGCSTCKQSGWVELLPCGMIHPNVLEMGGIDTERYTGFAFGLGLTRLVMMKYGIKDIRVLNSGNLGVLRQFR